MGPGNPVLNGGRYPRGQGKFWGWSGPFKSIFTVSAAVYAAKRNIQSSIISCRKRDHSVVNNGITV